MDITAITKQPVLAGHRDEGYVPARIAKHNDAGFIAIQDPVSGKYLQVTPDGGFWAFTGDSPGSWERFRPGLGATVVAHRRDGMEPGDLKGTPLVFAVA